MSRQPHPGEGAAVRAPVGASARAPSSPLSPARYRALRARYNALLSTLYERSTLTQRELASVAGRTERAMQMLVRALGCRPRNAGKCRPGTSPGLRRSGPPLPPLNASSTRRLLAAFAAVAAEIAASPQAKADAELNRVTARAARRAARTQSRIMASAARELTSLAAVVEHAAAAQQALAAEPARQAKASRARKSDRASEPRWPPDLERAQERTLRDQEARMWEAHQAARRAKAEAEAKAETEAAASKPQPRLRRL